MYVYGDVVIYAILCIHLCIIYCMFSCIYLLNCIFIDCLSCWSLLTMYYYFLWICSANFGIKQMELELIISFRWDQFKWFNCWYTSFLGNAKFPEKRSCHRKSLFSFSFNCPRYKSMWSTYPYFTVKVRNWNYLMSQWKRNVSLNKIQNNAQVNQRCYKMHLSTHSLSSLTALTTLVSITFPGLPVNWGEFYYQRLVKPVLN